MVDTGVAEGVTFTVHADGSSLPVRVYGGLGRAQAYAATAAIAVAYALGIEPEQAVLGLTHYRPVPGRMRLLKGIKDTTIIDDTYNASPLALHNALDALKEAPAKRRIVVIGDMLEAGSSRPSCRPRDDGR